MSELSVFDRQLSEKAKAGIKSAKQSYEKAKAENDTVGMAKANAYANSIRKQYGGYTGGDDGSAYYPVTGGMATEKPSYTSGYDKQIKAAQKAISQRGDFSYDPETDPVYTLYKKIYTRMGNDAYDRAYAKGAVKTGGIVNTNAMASAVQARNYYNSALADKATDLYNNAYNRYQDEIKRDYDYLEMLEKAEREDYLKFKDSLDDYRDTRDFEYKKQYDESKNLYNEIKDITDAAYTKSRDAAEDERWKAEKEYKEKYDTDKLALDIAKLDAETKKWADQSETDRYKALASLVKSVYNKSYSSSNLKTIMDMLGM